MSGKGSLSLHPFSIIIHLVAADAQRLSRFNITLSASAADGPCSVLSEQLVRLAFQCLQLLLTDRVLFSVSSWCGWRSSVCSWSSRTSCP